MGSASRCSLADHGLASEARSTACSLMLTLVCFRPGLVVHKDALLKHSQPRACGCNSAKAQYSNTPVLHHSARQDSRTRTTTRTRTKGLTRSSTVDATAQVAEPRTKV